MEIALFDFLKWREWLRVQADELSREGLSVECKINDRYLRGTCLEVRSNSKLASFRNFENGFVDYEIMDVETKAWLANKTMIQVNDTNFPAVFEKFASALRKLN